MYALLDLHSKYQNLRALTLTGDFAAYDHGKDNMDIYGTIDPPLYLPQKVTVPVSLYWGLNDWLASPTVS